MFGPIGPLLEQQEDRSALRANCLARPIELPTSPLPGTLEQKDEREIGERAHSQSVQHPTPAPRAAARYAL